MCDFAQYYHILDWRALPVRLAATLAAGLPEDSRSLLRSTGQRIPTNTMLLAYAADTLKLLEWHLFGREGSSPPPSLLAALTGTAEESDSDVQSFDSAEEFDAALAALKGG